MLYKCARAYQASVRAGRLTESLVAESHGVAWQVGLLDTACLSPAQRTAVEGQGYSLDANSSQENTGRFISYKFYANQTSDAAGEALRRDLLASGCLFSSDSMNIDSKLQTLFAPAVTGNYVWGSSASEPVFLRAASYSGGPQLLSMFDNGNVSFERISEAFSNLSDSMTSYVRTHGHPDYSAPAQGIVLHYATCLDVRWAWIAFPVALQLCTSALLAAVMASAARARTPLWKDSPLAWIYRGPALDIAGESTPPAASMKERAKGDVVVLDCDHDPRIRVAASNAEGGTKPP